MLLLTRLSSSSSETQWLWIDTSKLIAYYFTINSQTVFIVNLHFDCFGDKININEHGENVNFFGASVMKAFQEEFLNN